MKKAFLLLLVFGFFYNVSHAQCFGPSLVEAEDIVIDLSERLNERNRTWTYQTHLRIPPTPDLNCNARVNRLDYTVANKKIGFSNGKHWVSVDISEIPQMENIGRGSHSPTMLNAPVSITFTLTNAGPAKNIVQSDVASHREAIMVTDVTGMSAWYLASKFSRWMASGFQDWPYDRRDMYRQALTIVYAPKMTTCSFNSAGLMVTLPKTSISQLAASTRPGYTPFTLNFSCNDLQESGSTDRAIDMFLSSNSLLPSDNSVLVDGTPGAAKNVGIKVVKHETPSSPIVFSTSSLNRGSSTSIFNAAAGEVVKNNFSIGMGAYYFQYSPAQVTSGEIRATATLNIIYP